MYSPEDIKIWVGQIHKEVWNSFGDTAPELLQDVAIRAAGSVAQKRGAFWANPKTTSNLINSIMGGSNYTDNSLRTESEISNERILNVPYARIVEEGGETRVSPLAAKKFYAIYKKYGDIKYKRLYLIAKLGLRTVFKHLSHSYLSPAYDSVSDEVLDKFISKNLEVRLGNIPNIEVILVN